MPSLQVHILAGKERGKRLVFRESPVTFGREADNTLVIDVDAASRQHGELRVEGGQWVVENRSQNGTQVNRRRVKAKPMTVGAGDVLSIGGIDILGIEQAAVDEQVIEQAQPAQEARDSESAQPGGRVDRKVKLWIGIGAYLLAMLLLMIVLQSLGGKKQDSIKTAEKLSDARIAHDLREPLPSPPGQSDMRRAEEELRKARELYGQRDTKIDALYRCYRAFQQSLRYSGKKAFDDSLDQNRFFQVQDELVADATKRYNYAFTLLTEGNFESAAEGFKDLMDRLPNDPPNTVYANAVKQRALAKEQHEQLRRSR
ncbi:MAG: FHA domain-containing protein [Phycisphaera sp.]|nr:FHA domain-containing protein [Phycisphaera sp.]